MVDSALATIEAAKQGLVEVLSEKRELSENASKAIQVLDFEQLIVLGRIYGKNAFDCIESYEEDDELATARNYFELLMRYDEDDKRASDIAAALEVYYEEFITRQGKLKDLERKIKKDTYDRNQLRKAANVHKENSISLFKELLTDEESKNNVTHHEITAKQAKASNKRKEQKTYGIKQFVRGVACAVIDGDADKYIEEANKKAQEAKVEAGKAIKKIERGEAKIDVKGEEITIEDSKSMMGTIYVMNQTAKKIEEKTKKAEEQEKIKASAWKDIKMTLGLPVEQNNTDEGNSPSPDGETISSQGTTSGTGNSNSKSRPVTKTKGGSGSGSVNK